jgi:hypothetical protein
MRNIAALVCGAEITTEENCWLSGTSGQTTEFVKGPIHPKEPHTPQRAPYTLKGLINLS